MFKQYRELKAQSGPCQLQYQGIQNCCQTPNWAKGFSNKYVADKAQIFLLQWKFDSKSTWVTSQGRYWEQQGSISELDRQCVGDCDSCLFSGPKKYLSSSFHRCVLMTSSGWRLFKSDMWIQTSDAVAFLVWYLLLRHKTWKRFFCNCSDDSETRARHD